jgi:ATP-dependent Lon protease
LVLSFLKLRIRDSKVVCRLAFIRIHDAKKKVKGGGCAMKTIQTKDSQQESREMLHVIPTMDVVVFPHMLVPLLILDERIIKGVRAALDSSKTVLLLAAKKQSDSQNTIGTEDLYSIGTMASIMRLINIPEGGIKVLVQGIAKARVHELMTNEDGIQADVEKIEMGYDPTDVQIVAQINNIKNIAEKMASAGQFFSPDFYSIIARMQEPEKITDFVLSHLNLSVEQGQNLLEVSTMGQFLETIYQYLCRELEVAELEEGIKNRARESMNKAQKEFYLREQIRAIKSELGDDDAEEIDAYRQRLDKVLMTEEVRTEVGRQINRLERMAPDSMEAGVLRTYLDWVLALPWGTFTEDNLDIARAKEILDADHHGLTDIKERILDFISVCNLKMDGASPILCFIGPPGTGKTSLGQSIARCLNRKYVRISLGGVKDEAEIRGHRRTYVGSLPGRFIQAVKKAGSSNPVIVIDELDKIGSDFRGDPSSAMLEVLDPQQNKAFYDNYLGVPFDLSKVMFIATANSLETISGPLRDRMEIIELSGYTLEEKMAIAKQYLVARGITEAGLQGHDLQFSDDVLADLISNYTRESGVRELERLIHKLCSKVARSYVQEHKILTFDTHNIETYLGPRKFLSDDVQRENLVGISNGLAWTPCGGEMIRIEAVLMPGQGKLILTGHLGEVMKESAQAAMSYARAHAQEFSIPDTVFTSHDLHIHVPAGAIPKDGPSAGITMLTSILSALTKRPINAQYAMTGELNLSGEVMPIGGIKEKILAAKRNNVSHIILPLKNKHDILGMEDITKDIDVIWVHHANEVMKYVLLPEGKRKIMRQR